MSARLRGIARKLGGCASAGRAAASTIEPVELSEYQRLSRRTAEYPREAWLAYPALGLAGEAGEVAEHAKKAIRDDGGEVSDERRAAMAKELGDVLWYVAQLASELGLDLDEIAQGEPREAPLAPAPRRALRQRRRALGGRRDREAGEALGQRAGTSACTRTPSAVSSRVTSPASSCSSARLPPSA